jgi:tetratricopeptide (TPR) repeat protein
MSNITRLICSIFVLATIGGGAASAQEPHEAMHSHPAPEKLGTVTFPTSCAPSVAKDFNRAVALLHSFAYTPSEHAFRQISAADPTCAMAHWGIAMSRWHELWAPPDADDLSIGTTEVAQTARLKVRSDREKQFIAAASAFFEDPTHRPHDARAQAYSTQMAQAATSNPADTEVQVFYALSLLATASLEDSSHANQKRAAAILEPIYQAHPDHPGVAHYLIHAYDNTELAQRGLPAARAYAKVAPSAPHALHMPSHIFTRLGLWDDSIASNIAARTAAHEQGDLGEELHAMDYLTYAYLQRGRQADAAAVVADAARIKGLNGRGFQTGYGGTAMPVRLAMELHRWDAAVALQPLPDSPPNIEALVFWARAVANSRAGHPQAAEPDIARLNQCQEELREAGDTYWATQVEVLDREARAWSLATGSRAEDAVKLLSQAADEEDSVEKRPLTPGPIIPAREQLGDLLLTLKHPQEALKEYQAALSVAPRRRGALAGAAEAAQLTGDTEVAARMESILLN